MLWLLHSHQVGPFGAFWHLHLLGRGKRFHVRFHARSSWIPTGTVPNPLLLFLLPFGVILGNVTTPSVLQDVGENSQTSKYFPGGKRRVEAVLVYHHPHLQEVFLEGNWILLTPSLASYGPTSSSAAAVPWGQRRQGGNSRVAPGAGGGQRFQGWKSISRAGNLRPAKTTWIQQGLR